MIVVLCFLIVVIDGFDIVLIGFIVFVICVEWGLLFVWFVLVFGVGLVGLMVGVFVFGLFGDWFGCKCLLFVCVVCFGIVSVVLVSVGSLIELIVWCFVIGFGFGGVMLNVIMLMFEYCLVCCCLLFVMMMFCGFMIGFVFGGFVVVLLIEYYGWCVVLVVGGVVLLLFLLLFVW